MNKTLPVYIIKETAIIDDLIRFDIFFLSKNILNNCEFKKNMQNTYSFIEDKENLNIFNKMITNLSEHEKWNITEKNIFYIFTNLVNHEEVKNIFSVIKTGNFLFFSLVVLRLIWMCSKTSTIFKNEICLSSNDEVINEIENFLNKLFIWLSVKKKINIKIDSKNMRSIIFKITEILIQEKNILAQKINVKSKFGDNKTIKYLYIKNTQKVEILKTIDIYYDKFEIINSNREFYICTNHFSSISKIFKENYRSGAKFEWYNEETLKNLCENWVFIDIDHLKTIYNKLLKEKKIKNSLIFDDYEFLLTQAKNAIEEKNFILLSQISKRISIYEHTINIKKISEWEDLKNKKIYLPFSFDFRGRIYYKSIISPTFNTEFRYCLNQGEYCNWELENSNNHFYSNKINLIFEKNLHVLKKINAFSRIINLNKNIQISFLWVMLSLAEIDKKKLGKSIKLEDFLEHAVKMINYPREFNFEESIKYDYLIKILDEINNNIFIKRLVSKDATASVFQHLVKCLGYSSQFSLKLCNLNSENTWYDTYQHLIDEFKKRTSIYDLSEFEFEEIFNRKTLKRTAMTENYSAKELTCWKYFNDEIDISVYSEKKRVEIRKIFKCFYQFLHNNTYILKKNSKKIVQHFTQKKQATFSDNSTANYRYYKSNEMEIDLIINGQRSTKKFLTISENEDLNKFKNAIKANYVQSLDACLVRWVINKEKVITIHDCFMIDYMKITNLICILNEGMSQTFHEELGDESIDRSAIFSIFIVL